MGKKLGRRMGKPLGQALVTDRWQNHGGQLTTENRMAVYMIAYDLHEGEDYNDLIKAIKALPSRSWHNLGSTWFVISKQAAVQIHNSLKRHLLAVTSSPCGNWGAW
jgi:23S rRNA A2030 N6-methylase RlmJ